VPLFVFREGHAGVGSGKKRREAGTRGGVIRRLALSALPARSGPETAHGIATIPGPALPDPQH
jgi:hypothetical protein